MQQVLYIGDTLNQRIAGGDYPASAGWVLTYNFRLVSGTGAIDVACVADGDDHLLQVPAATTAGWTAGGYTWRSRATLGTEVYTVETGQITVLANIATATGNFDGRTQAQKAYDDAREAYATFSASNGTKRRYRIGDREMEFSSAADIVQTINYWAIEVRREQRADALAKGLADPRKTYVRFDRA